MNVRHTMVTAEKRYTGSLATPVVPKLRVAPRREQVNNRQSESAISANDKRRILVTTVIVGAICIVMVIMAAFAAQLRIENNGLIKENEAIQNEIDTLNVELQSANSLENVEKVAISKLGMVYPSPDQCVYVTEEDTPKGDFATVIKNNAYN